METNGFEVPDGGGVSGDGDWMEWVSGWVVGGWGDVGTFLRNLRDSSEKIPRNFLKMTGWFDN